MHILESKPDLLQEIAQACDLCLKPWRHSIVNDSTIQKQPSNDDLIDLILRVECRDLEGKRLQENDLEIEIYNSGDDLSITLSWIDFPDRPILWQGKHSVWMDSKSGMLLKVPAQGAALEGLARRLRSIFINDALD